MEKSEWSLENGAMDSIKKESEKCMEILKLLTFSPQMI